MRYIPPAKYVYCPDCGFQIEAGDVVVCFCCDTLICPTCRPDVEWEAESCAAHLATAFARMRIARDDARAELERLRVHIVELGEEARREAA